MIVKLFCEMNALYASIEVIQDSTFTIPLGLRFIDIRAIDQRFWCTIYVINAPAFATALAPFTMILSDFGGDVLECFFRWGLNQYVLIHFIIFNEVSGHCCSAT